MSYRFDGDKVFFTSDTHFNHENIVSFCERPFKDAKEMDETLINNWNRVVGEDDIVFHLGDFCFGGVAKWKNYLDRLNGRVYLILGNHDLKNIRQGLTGRFEEVNGGMCIWIEDYQIFLSHYPFLCFEGGYRDDVWQLFGHVHSRIGNTGFDADRLNYLYPTQLDVGVDNNNFTPLSYNEVKLRILEQIKNRGEKL